MSDVPEAPGWWEASDGKWYPPDRFPAQMASAPAPATPVLITVGDIACTADQVLIPNGQAPLRHTVWIVSNATTTTEAIPTWAIVMTVLFVWFCLLGLLFLLVKERTTTGHVQVSVQGDGVYYATQIPVSSPSGVIDVEQRVNYIRGLVAALS